MLCNFQYKPRLSVGNLQCIQDWWKVIIKLYVNNGANYGNDTTLGSGFCGLGSRLCCVIPTYDSHSNTAKHHSS